MNDKSDDRITFAELERDLQAQVTLNEALIRRVRKHNAGRYVVETDDLERACETLVDRLAAARNGLAAMARVPDDDVFTRAIVGAAEKMASHSRTLVDRMKADGVWQTA